jgi:hypothetical protein
VVGRVGGLTTPPLKLRVVGSTPCCRKMEITSGGSSGRGVEDEDDDDGSAESFKDDEAAAEEWSLACASVMGSGKRWLG